MREMKEIGASKSYFDDVLIQIDDFKIVSWGEYGKSLTMDQMDDGYHVKLGWSDIFTTKDINIAKIVFQDVKGRIVRGITNKLIIVDIRPSLLKGEKG